MSQYGAMRERFRYTDDIVGARSSSRGSRFKRHERMKPSSSCYPLWKERAVHVCRLSVSLLASDDVVEGY
jgi:hypothetical protein